MHWINCHEMTSCSCSVFSVVLCASKNIRLNWISAKFVTHTEWQPWAQRLLFWAQWSILNPCFLHFLVAWKVECIDTSNMMNVKPEGYTVVYYIVLLNSNISASAVFSGDHNWEQTELALLEVWQVGRMAGWAWWTPGSISLF